MKPCVSCVVNIDLDKYFSVYFTGYVSTIECMWHNILDTEVIVWPFFTSKIKYAACDVNMLDYVCAREGH